MSFERAWQGHAVAALTCASVLPAHAGVTEFTDRAEWETAVGAFTTVNFTGFPEFTVITDQYADLGVFFTDANDVIRLSDNLFPTDGAGLGGGAFDDIELSFVTPQLWIAVDFPGLVHFELFQGAELIYSSTVFSDILGNFAGLLSTQPFDAALISDPSDDAVFIDDLHFGVPTPPTLALLAFAALIACRRRRR